MDLYEHLKLLSEKFLGGAFWTQNNPLDVCNALLAMAYVQQWDPDGRDAYFLVRAHNVLEQGSDQGNT